MDEWIDEAVQRLPERQRRALELREREQLSYERIAVRMETGVGQVAQLIERGRINLYDEMRGTPLATVAAPSRECERALPAIAAREDGELETLEVDAAWLDDHLAACERCRPAVEQLGEAAAAYKAWVRGETAAVGATADGVAAEPAADVEARGSMGGGPGPRRRRVVVAGIAAAMLLLAGVATAFVVGGDDGAPSVRAAVETTSGKVAGESRPDEAKAGMDRKRRPAAGRRKVRRMKARSAGDGVDEGSGGAAGEPAATTVSGPTSGAPGAPGATGAPGAAGSDPVRPSGKAGIGPTQKTVSPQPSSKPKPAPASTQASQPVAPPAPQPSPPAEEDPAPGRSGEAPGKPPDRPPR